LRQSDIHGQIHSDGQGAAKSSGLGEN
jgi:hypothetical protein